MPAASYCAGLVMRSVVTELGDTTSTTSRASTGRTSRVPVPNNAVNEVAPPKAGGRARRSGRGAIARTDRPLWTPAGLAQ
jgi:hypothetical protein